MKRWGALLCCLLSGPVFASVLLRLETPLEIHNLIVAPGHSTEYEFRVRNVGTSSGSGSFSLNERRYGQSSFDQYQWTSLTPDCGPVTTSVYYERRVLTLPILTIGVQETRTCRYRIDRQTPSLDDLSLAVCSYEQDWHNCYRHQLNVGSLPDTTLRLERAGPAEPGSNTLLVRLVAENFSAHAIRSRVATTQCREFAGGIFDTPPYDIDTDFPGGCASALGELCLNFTGQNFDAYGFELGPIPAHGSHSCLIKLVPRANPPTWYGIGPYATEFYFANDNVALSDGGAGFDPNADNGQVIFGLPEASPVPLSRWTAGLLASMVLTLGLASVTRRLNRKRVALS